MATAPHKVPKCNCCGLEIVVPPTQSVPSFDKDIGQVCEDCKTLLRWSQAFLKHAKIEGSTTDAPDHK